jgi:rhodanese-related sulfurtransferase
MTHPSAILSLAQQRARQMGLPYQGALLPNEAYAVLQHMPDAKLVDVRSRAELDWVGRIPDAVVIEWVTYPNMQPNPHFLSQLELQVKKAAHVLFICRSGARSSAAATLATQSGYAQCYNVLEGFEGDRDTLQHRNTLNGWRVAGLPWIQS